MRILLEVGWLQLLHCLGLACRQIGKKEVVRAIRYHSLVRATNQGGLSIKPLWRGESEGGKNPETLGPERGNSPKRDSGLANCLFHGSVSAKAHLSGRRRKSESRASGISNGGLYIVDRRMHQAKTRLGNQRRFLAEERGIARITPKGG